MVEQTLPDPKPGLRIGVSVSDSPDLARLGLTDTHVRMALGSIARAVLTTGGHIVYGGRLDPNGYTAFLVHECERFGVRDRPFTGFVSFSEHKGLSPKQIQAAQKSIGLLGQYVFLDPDGSPIADPSERPGPGTDQLDAGSTGRALTGLREHMTEQTDARVVIGGKRANYEGRMPGVVEETILSIRANMPIFVAGGFGGAAGDVATVLGCDPKHWLDLPDRSGSDDLTELAATAEDVHWEPTSNGLTLEQNQQLAVSYRASEIASLVVRGLISCFGESPESELRE